MTDTTTPSAPASTATTVVDIAAQATTIATNIETITTDVATAAADITTASLWTAILGFFTALPGIVALIRDFMAWVNKISGNNPQAFISDVGTAFSKLANAKTQDDYASAAQGLSSVISKLPPG